MAKNLICTNLETLMGGPAIEETLPFSSGGVKFKNIDVEAGTDNTSKIAQAKIDAKISKLLKEYDKCINAKFGESVSKAKKGSKSGHCNFNGTPYDILNYNCHSAANISVSNASKTTGIIKCGGSPEYGDPSNHTFNYKVKGKLIVYYNWGQTCRAPLGDLPPDLSDPDHDVCIREFCGDNYVAGPAALPIGSKVEEPGPAFCAADTSDRNTCKRCCSFRGTFWDRDKSDIRPTDLTFTKFMSQCLTTCSKTHSAKKMFDTSRKFKVSFEGGAFTGSAVTGSGMKCNRTTAHTCHKYYRAGSNLIFRINTTIYAGNNTFVYDGKVRCNNITKRIRARGAVAELSIDSIEEDYKCIFLFSKKL